MVGSHLGEEVEEPRECVFALANGANMTDSWYYDDWMNGEHKDMAICSCNDGLRPVIIKVERTDEVSKA